MYVAPPATAFNPDGSVAEPKPDDMQQHFEDFYEDVFNELSNFGEIDEMKICDNIGDHLLGNVYVKFFDEESAEKAVKGLSGRFYAGRPISAEFSPVTDFREARCRQYDMGECTRGGYCNFMHLKIVSRNLEKRLFHEQKKRYRSRSRSRSKSRERKRSRSPKHKRSRRSHSRSRSGSRGRGDRDRERDRDRRDRDRDRDRERDRRDRDRERYRDPRGPERGEGHRERERDYEGDQYS